MEKTINFNDFMAKKHHFEGLTERELETYKVFKTMLIVGVVGLASAKVIPAIAVGMGIQKAVAVKAFLQW